MAKRTEKEVIQEVTEATEEEVIQEVTEATEEEVIQEVTEATEEEVIQEVTASTSDASTKYIKTIPNPFEVKGYEVPHEVFELPELDEDQQKAFDHAIKCGIIKEVE